MFGAYNVNILVTNPVRIFSITPRNTDRRSIASASELELELESGMSLVS